MPYLDPAQSRQTRERLEQLLAEHCDGQLRPALEPILPRVADLLTEQRSEPPQQTAETIERLIQEQISVDEGGDSLRHDDAEASRLSDLLMTAQPEAVERERD